MRALLVVNPNARRGRELAAEVRGELAAHGVTVVEHGDQEYDCVVVGGGDGTFAGQIPRALGRGVPMGLVPLGTFNELARTLGIPADVHAACALIATGHARAVDVARVNGRYYVNEASIGISSRIARLQTPQDKRRFGLLAVLATAFLAFLHSRPIQVRVEFDERCETFKTVQLTVANSHRFGGLLDVAGAAIDDGWLDLYGVAVENAFQAFAVLRAMLAGRPQNVPGLRAYRSTAFEVRTKRRHRITADGEPAGKTPALFEVLPKALRVFAPQYQQ